MTILDRSKEAQSDEANKSHKEEAKVSAEEGKKNPPQEETASDGSSLLSGVESQFKNIMAEFQANTGFSVDTGEQPVDTMLELLSGKEVAVSIAVLLSYIRYCVNHGLKKDITLKIGYNKPPTVPMNFAINDELLGDIYPGDVVEIN